MYRNSTLGSSSFVADITVLGHLHYWRMTSFMVMTVPFEATGMVPPPSGIHTLSMSRPQVGIERLPARRMSNEPRESMNCKSCRKRKVWKAQALPSSSARLPSTNRAA